ncbi:hypothetical protein K501DRAFT_286197 [Backusella circina FSU 941]|nr:hypothetical protein K501DRAFT_286197 [Backusella circina FSU 941]
MFEESRDDISTDVTYKDLIATSPNSAEWLVYNYLQPQLTQQSKKPRLEQTFVIPQSQQHGLNLLSNYWDDSFLSLAEEESQIQISFNSFTDIKTALEDLDGLDPFQTTSIKASAISELIKKGQNGTNLWSMEEENFLYMSFVDHSIPPSVRHNIESSQMLGSLMYRAKTHWCCVGFKVAPIDINLINNWQIAPPAIIYCIATISLVTFVDQHANNMFAKQAALVFYEQAKNKMDDIFLDNINPITIQCYFCLSYTSNLLRMYDQQRTWGGLASISLQHLAKTKKRSRDFLESPVLQCWYRWYYIDTWMCLTLNRECLLPNTIPGVNFEELKELSITEGCGYPKEMYHPYLKRFAVLTHYMRKYIQLLNTGLMFETAPPSYTQRMPSGYYFDVDNQLTGWYNQLKPYLNASISCLHFNMCYHSLRLIVLYQFLAPSQPPNSNILVDTLQTNLELLQSLQYFKDIGCDQGTYHHMFFAIHNTAKRIYQYVLPSQLASLRSLAKEQLQINLILLENTQAYISDVFKMRIYAEKIKDQFRSLGIEKANKSESNTLSSTILVFRQNDLHSIQKK